MQIVVGEQILASLKGSDPNKDIKDYYKIQLQTDKSYKIQLKSNGNLDLDLYIYDAPTEDSRSGSSTRRNNSNEEILFKAQSNNMHYILVVIYQLNNSKQQYELIVNEQ